MSADDAPLMRFKAKRCATLDQVRAWVEQELRPARTNTDEHGLPRKDCAAPIPGSLRGHRHLAVSSAQLAANAALSLLNLCCYLLDRQLAILAATFEKEGGFTERLYRIRTQARTRPTTSPSS